MNTGALHYPSVSDDVVPGLSSRKAQAVSASSAKLVGYLASYLRMRAVLPHPGNASQAGDVTNVCQH